MTTLHQVCLLLGSNIQPEENILLAIEHLKHSVHILKISSVWQSPSVGFAGPDFLNLAVLAATPLTAAELKEQVLRPLEDRLGRVRTADKNAPRTMDIDIILFDGAELDPILWQYAFRAVPVAELLPEYRSKNGNLLKDAAAELSKGTPLRPRPDVQIHH